MPERIQRKRTKGYRMPPNTVSVTRPGIFGNPFTAAECRDAEQAVWLYSQWMNSNGRFADYKPLLRAYVQNQLGRLRGKNLACFCPLNQPCHADVLLEIANHSTGQSAGD